MAIRTYLIFKENGKEVLNTQIFGNNFWDNSLKYLNLLVKTAFQNVKNLMVKKLKYRLKKFSN